MVTPMCNLSSSSSSSSSTSLRQEEEVKYRGVRKRKWGKWVSEIRLPNSRERIWLGSFDTQQKAAKAFDVALFCLRGENAKFNFPDNPPNIVGGQSLRPHEIQHVASQFANNEEQQQQEVGLEEEQTCMRSDDNNGNNNTTLEDDNNGNNNTTLEDDNNEGEIDWSFLNMMELDDNYIDVTRTIPDYSLYSGIDCMSCQDDDLYMPHLVPRKDDNNGGEDNGDGNNNGGDLSHPYSLWNF